MKNKVKPQTANKILSKTCKCGKVIKSLYKKQLEYNFKQHKEACGRKK
jgi:hypothetical protein